MSRYRWLLFDADNTIFDFDAAEDYALTHTLLNHGLPPEEDRKARYRATNAALWTDFDHGLITQDALVIERFRRFLSAEGLEGEPEEWNRCYLDLLSADHTRLPGAEELCRKLAGRYTLALVTNGVAYVQRRRLTESGLEGLFGDRVYISAELGCRKPEPVFFEKALTALGAAEQRDRVLVVGDSLTSDIAGAVNSGLDCVWYNPGGKASRDRLPTYTVDSFDALEALLL